MGKKIIFRVQNHLFTLIFCLSQTLNSDQLSQHSLVKQCILQHLPHKVNAIVRLALENLKEITFEKLNARSASDSNTIITYPKNTLLFKHLENLNSISIRFHKAVASTCFSQMRQLTTLEIKECVIHEINSEMFKELTSLTKLTLSWNDTSKIEAHSFANLTRLETLDLSGNRLEKIPSGLFKSLTNLQSLDLSFNRKCMLIKSYAFASLTSLVRLNLNTRTKFLKTATASANWADLFNYMKKLTHLSCYFESDLTGTEFDQLNSLEDLFIRCHTDKSIRINNWANLQGLKKFSIVFNEQLEKTADSTIKSLERLEELDLVNGVKIGLVDIRSRFPRLNKLRLREGLGQKLDQRALDSLKFVNDLTLKGNRFKQNTITLKDDFNVTILNINDCFLQKVVFEKSVSKLEELYMNSNFFKCIDANMFSTLANLKVLSLKSNQVEVIDETAFKHLTRLEELDLSENSISALSPVLFVSLKNLKNFKVNQNNLDRLNDTGLFAGLGQLEELDLRGNQLVKIAPEIFKHLTNLKILFLNKNPELDFDGSCLKYMSSLKHLFIDANNCNSKFYIYIFDVDLKLHDTFHFHQSESIGNKAFRLENESDIYWD